MTMRGFAIFSVLLLAGSPAISDDLLVDAGFEGTPGSMVRGARAYRTVAAALGTVPRNNAEPVTVRIADGRYDEKLVVDRAMVRLVGESRDGTIITHGDTGDSIGPDGSIMGTDGSFTIRVVAPDFRADNLTIRNHFDYAANALLEPDDPARVTNTQGVALLLDEGSDRALFSNVNIDGNQDTLFADAGRSYFRNVRISGHVDFIFGAGQAVFENCEIVSRNRANKNPTGYITAPSTRVDMPFGFLFLNCSLLKESPDVPPGSVRLGRPWHPGADPGVNGSAVFLDCFMDDHVGPQGFAPISARNPAGERIWFEVGPESRFFEFGSHGPGGQAGPHRPQLSAEAAAWYTIDNVLNGWRPGE